MFKVTVEELVPREGADSRYIDNKTLYFQTVDRINLQEIIKAVNFTANPLGYAVAAADDKAPKAF